MFYLRRFNHHFNAPSYVRENGEFTLHLDKARSFGTFDEACDSLRDFPGTCVVDPDEVRRMEKILAKQR